MHEQATVWYFLDALLKSQAIHSIQIPLSDNISSNQTSLLSMASALRCQWIPTVKATKKRCRSRSVNLDKIVFGRSINGREREQIRMSQFITKGVEKTRKDWRIQCKEDDGVFSLQPQRDNSASVELVAEFYRRINHKDEIGVLELISDECCYEDLVFYLPFKGRKEIGHFLHELMEAMGPHIKFVVENFTNGRKNSASVIWHLEWREKRIPFATGYNNFEFHEVGEKLLIGKIRGLEEMPVKPGDLALKLLKTAATLFDCYPSTAEVLLSTPHNMHDVVYVILHAFADIQNQSDSSKQK